jgi:TctA family transporter
VRLERPIEPRQLIKQELKGLWPTHGDLREAWPAVLRGTALGAVLGLLPGGGAQLSSFASYAVERRLAEATSKFGKGDLRGVAGPESANNAGAQTSFIPMLSWGIPTNAVMALMIGAMTIKGITPGPQVMTNNPRLFWGLVASMWVGNLMLVVLNLPLVGLWARLLRVPYRAVFPALTLVCCFGVYALKGSPFDLYLAALFACVGYLLHKLSCEAAPLLLGFILGPMMEENLRRALLLSHGDWSAFITRPISAGLLSAAALMVVIVLLPTIHKKRDTTFLED